MRGIDPRMTETRAREWASRRYGCKAKTRRIDHPTCIGASIYMLEVEDSSGQRFRGIGYGGIAPLGVSGWAKAAANLELSVA